MLVTVTHPGVSGFVMSIFDFKQMNQAGDYHIMLEETTIKRLPHPYSNCIIKGSKEAYEMNLFTNEYTRGSCQYSCDYKAELTICGAVLYGYRLYLRDEAFLRKHYVDRYINQTMQCISRNQSLIQRFKEKCYNLCRTPCEEVLYSITEKFVPTIKKSPRIKLYFYYQELKKSYIEYVPSYEVSTLLANFGGQLGLMAGVSALSIIELIIWFVLFLAEKVCRLYIRSKRNIIRTHSNGPSSSIC